MPVLSNELRNQLAKVMVNAREEAEAGAHSALHTLAVNNHEPYGSMTPEQRCLRNRLRAHGRQLGDQRDQRRGTQEIDRLVHECAYQHWHRMLFARFLAENNLLVEPESGVAITMIECEDLAREQGEDPWTMASSFAERMLPQIFQTGNPVFEITLPPETRQTLERLLMELSSAVFTADDSLGWTYQFWQSAQKKRVNNRVNSGEKVTGQTLPALTQLFTEHYMVLFLLHNTIGAWHAGKVLAALPEFAKSAMSEQELREAVVLGNYSFDYLRLVREAADEKNTDEKIVPWRPAAGTFDAWPRQAMDLKVLDPCCGSGHFLVAVFDLLVRLRINEEGISLDNAVKAVLSENLFGLELDARCTQIAAFNLALTAWKMVGRVINLPALNIACSGLAVGVSKNEWLKFTGNNIQLQECMNRLFELFRLAPEIGSLIDPRRAIFGGKLFSAEFDQFLPMLEQILNRDDVSNNEDQREIGVTAQGITKAAALLSGDYTLVTTNVPYLGNRKQASTIRQHSEEYYPESKQDLATVFLQRMLAMATTGGTVAAVTPQYWLFLSSYNGIRKRILESTEIGLVAKLGSGAFKTISGEVVNAALVTYTRSEPDQDHDFYAVDVTASTEPSSKAHSLKYEPLQDYQQIIQLENPDFRIAVNTDNTESLLSNSVITPQGVKTGDDFRFVRTFWEFPSIEEGWLLYQTSVTETVFYSGRSLAIDWRSKGREMIRPRTENAAIGCFGVGISQVGALPATLYTGERYDSSIAVLIPKEQSLLAALWLFCSSEEYRRAVRSIDQKAFVTNNTLAKVTFDIDSWKDLALQQFPTGLPYPHSDNSTQWLFHGHPAKAEEHATLQVAVARLIGYRWPAEQDPDMLLAAEAREWIIRCRELDGSADKDGIVCLSPVRGESSAADQLRRLLSAAFGSKWSPSKERQILQAAAGNGKHATSLEEWLRDKFFEEHCKLFHHRPFIWNIWDGRNDGFNALINYHRLAGPDGEGRRMLEALTYTYLGDWIERQKAEQNEDKEGADARLAAALNLQEQLQKILEGEPPYDMFVRWKPLHKQPVGWEPDINDGVRINIRPFMSATLRKGGRTGAGILRWKPNIKWGKDRGKEPQDIRPKVDFPWFWNCDPEKHSEHRVNFAGGQRFDGNRWNELYYNNAVKLTARERSAKGATL